MQDETWVPRRSYRSPIQWHATASTVKQPVRPSSAWGMVSHCRGPYQMSFSQMLQPLVRHASDWLDLQWSFIIEDLHRVAPRAHGRMLDVGCGDKPYEDIFRSRVTEYIGVEHEGTFGLTDAAQRGKGPDVLYDGFTLPFEDATFDTVLNVQVLEHTPHPQRLVDEMA